MQVGKESFHNQGPRGLGLPPLHISRCIKKAVALLAFLLFLPFSVYTPACAGNRYFSLLGICPLSPQLSLMFQYAPLVDSRGLLAFVVLSGSSFPPQPPLAGVPLALGLKDRMERCCFKSIGCSSGSGISFFFKNNLLIRFKFLVALGLHCCKWTFSSCGEQELTLHCSTLAACCSGFSCCRDNPQVLAALQQLWCMVLVALRCVGFSRIRG